MRGLLLGGCFLVSLLTGCTSVVLHPDRVHRLTPALERYAREDVFVPGPGGGRLHGWVLTPNRPTRATLVFFHGNAENISTHVNAVLWLVDEGYRVFALDYRGFGLSEGEADVAGAHADALAILDAVFNRSDVDPDKVGVLGQSFGSAAAIYAVANSPHRKRVRLLVVDSAFPSYAAIAQEKSAGCCLTWPFQLFAAGAFRGLDEHYAPQRWIGDVAPVPILFLHGSEDSVIPLQYGRQLFDLAPEPKGWWVVERVGHTRAFSSANLRREMLQVLQQRVVLGEDMSVRM